MSHAFEAAGWIARIRERVRDPRFWVIQSLVVAVTISHGVLEMFEILTKSELAAAYFVPASLYFVPAVYASLIFGREGAIPTAIWSSVLALPNILIWHSGLERVGETIQMATMVTIAILVATRVDRESAARERAEEEGSARRMSEAKYRGLFSSAAEAILVLTDVRIEDANGAAARLIGGSADDLRGRPVADVLGAENAEHLLSASRHEGRGGEFPLRTTGQEVWVEPVCSPFVDPAGVRVVQAILRDVTERRARQHGLEAYADRMLRAQEEERLRIARDIHDGTIQSLVLLCRRLDTLGETAADGSHDAERALHDSRRLAESVADELRRISRDLRPAVLDDLGLVPALRWLLDEMSLRAGIVGQLHVRGDPRRMPSERELCLFRIAQEALQNVERHAEASLVEVTLEFDSAMARLEVVDDGRGLPMRSVGHRAPEQIGLLGMSERARLLGGRFHVSSRAEGGTRLEACVPLAVWSTPAGVSL